MTQYLQYIYSMDISVHLSCTVVGSRVGYGQRLAAITKRAVAVVIRRRTSLDTVLEKPSRSDTEIGSSVSLCTSSNKRAREANKAMHEHKKC